LLIKEDSTLEAVLLMSVSIRLSGLLCVVEVTRIFMVSWSPFYKETIAVVVTALVILQTNF